MLVHVNKIHSIVFVRSFIVSHLGLFCNVVFGWVLVGAGVSDQENWLFCDVLSLTSTVSTNVNRNFLFEYVFGLHICVYLYVLRVYSTMSFVLVLYFVCVSVGCISSVFLRVDFYTVCYGSICRNGKLTSTASSLRGPDTLPQKLYLMLPSVSHDHDKPVSLADTTVHRAMSSIAGERLATYCPAVPHVNPAGFVLFFSCKAPW